MDMAKVLLQNVEKDNKQDLAAQSARQPYHLELLVLLGMGGLGRIGGSAAGLSAGAGRWRQSKRRPP